MMIEADYAALVEELCLDKPDKNKLKQLCEKTGYIFSDNLVELMSDVLIQKEPQTTKASKTDLKNNLKIKDTTKQWVKQNA